MDNQLIKNKSYKLIIMVIAIVSFAIMLFMSTTTDQSVKEQYNYKNTEIENYFLDDRELDTDSVLSDTSTGKYELSNNTESLQRFDSNVDKTVFFKVYTEESDVNIDGLKVDIVSDKSKLISTTTIQRLDKHSLIVTTNEKLNNDDLNLRITNNTGETINFLCFSKKNGSTVGGTTVDLSLIVGYNGYQNNLNLTLFTIVTALLVLSVSVSVFDFLNKMLIRKEKSATFLTIFIEFILSLIVASLLFINIAEYSYTFNIDFTYYFLFVISFIILTIYILRIFVLNRQRIEIVYVAIIIPLALMFSVFVLPDMVNDETTHFCKAVLTSQFKITNSTAVELPVDYKGHGVMTYHELSTVLRNGTDYAKTYTINQAVSYNVIGYIIPSIGVLIARLLNISIYFGYLFARLNNLIAFIVITYFAIKKMPVGKMLLALYLMNPMMINQAISVSADCLINAISIFAIAYFMHLKYDDNPIMNKDVVILGLCFSFLFLEKMVYVVIFLLVFTLGKKLKTIKLKQLMILLFIVLGTIMVYFGYNALLPTNNGLAQNVDHLNRNNVNSVLQSQYLMSNPTNALMVVANSTISNGADYLFRFLGQSLARGEYTMTVPTIFPFLYLLVLIISCISIKEEKRFKILDKIIFVFIFLFTYAATIIALYLAWTSVGASTASGVQGRYFLPVFILVLFCIVSNKRLRIPYLNTVLITTTLVVNLAVLVNVAYVFI